MFYTNKDKAQVSALRIEIEYLKSDILKLKHQLGVQNSRITNFLMSYPYGTTRTGEPRQKPGRKPKGTA